jgi:hypothetical protein
MRLINVDTFELCEFFGDEIPPYAILSHRWGKDEVLFEVLSADLPRARTLAGFEKIAFCAKQAKIDGLLFCWVDTCCIDKRSSSELSEAINSMYQWYQNAVYCYAYLADVSIPSPPYETVPRYALLRSEWFSRGWTLQELIAPMNLRFYSARWDDLGPRRKYATSISRNTGIDERILRGQIPVDSVNIAQRMRWASSRKTTRVEDKAYCLMGIFDVNMPLLYGEGIRSFTRLQEEIIRRSPDHSIFTWIDRSASRASFQHCHNVVSLTTSAPFALSNIGLNIALPLKPLEPSEESDTNPREYLATLRCVHKHSGKNIAIRLRPTFFGSNQFARVDPYRLYGAIPNSDVVDFYVPEKPQVQSITGDRVAGFKVTLDTIGCDMKDLHGDGDWHKSTGLVRFNEARGKDHFMVVMLFVDWLVERKRRIVVLVYNPQSVAITFAEGLHDGQSRTVYPNAFESFVGIPLATYKVQDTPWTNAEWQLPTWSISSVKMSKTLFKDELFITAHVQVNTANAEKHYPMSDSTSSNV